MENNLNENVVIYDWLSFTTKQHTPEQVIAALGLSECPWSDITGAHGYMDRKYFGNISIHYNGREDMGVWCEMSSQGCRNFEGLTTLSDKWQTLFAFIYGNSLHITRLDAAFDDHTGILDIERIAQGTQDQRFVSRRNTGRWCAAAAAQAVRSGALRVRCLSVFMTRRQSEALPMAVIGCVWSFSSGTSKRAKEYLKCSVCSKCFSNPIPISPDTHTWVEVSRTGATCTAAGSITRSCSRCGFSVSEDIPALGTTNLVKHQGLV